MQPSLRQQQQPSSGPARFRWRRPPDVSSADLHPYCSARFHSQMSDFPEFLRARSQIRVTTFLPTDIEIEYFGDELAEDGRKKSNTLPPLEREASFARQPRKGAVSVSTNSHTLRNSEEKALRKVSIKMDRKIVSHLKVHLNKRLQKRLDHQGDRLEYPSDEEGKEKRAYNARDGQISGHGDRTIFTSYSETGEKITASDGRRLKASKSPSRPLPGGHRSSLSSTSVDMAGPPAKEDSMGEDATASTAFRKTSPLPGIPSTNLRDAQTNGVNGLSHTEDGTGETGGLDEEDIYIQTLDDDVDDDDEVEELDFRLVDVSPVQTPSASRPQSSAADWTSSADHRAQASEMLAGSVHGPCPPDRAVINLYIAAGYSDTEAERFFMQEHLYPGLRAHCMHKGHELRVHDLHWGFKDATADDHRVPDIMQEVIAKLQDSMHGLNFVVVLGHKTGQGVLPASIPQEELDRVTKVAATSAHAQRAELKARIAEVEAARSEREAKGRLEGLSVGQSDGAPSPGRLSDDAPDAARTAITRDGSEDVQPSAAEQRRAQNLASRREQQELRALREAEENIPDVELLYQWYRLDENSVPAVYRLHPISSMYKDILRNDAAKRAAAKTSYEAVAAKIHRIFTDFAPQVLQDESALRKYSSSVLEQEVHCILEHAPATTGHHTAVMVRSLDRCQQGLQDAAAVQYLDVIQGKTPSLDTHRWNRMEALRKKTTEMIPEKLCANFLLDWFPEGIRPSGLREHFVYAERMCKTIHDLVAKQLAEAPSGMDTCFAGGGVGGIWRKKLFEEVAEHIRCSQNKSQDFQGRKDILTMIKSYLKSDYRRPLVLHGRTGSGKSAIISKTAKEINKWFISEAYTPRVLVRMIGSTMDSINVRTLIRSVCLQLCHIFGTSPTHVPTDSKGIFNDFTCRLGQAKESKPLILLFDAADRLSDEHDGRKLMWLPTELPPYVHIIISTISDEKMDCLPCAQKLLAGHDRSFLEVPKLQEDCAWRMMARWLRQAHRTLTDSQTDLVVKAFSKCPSPLFLQLIVTDAIRWTSSTKPESIRLGESVKQVSTLKFGRLERDHGEALTRRALGYISASRNGLSVSELEDLLSLDDAAMDEVMATYKPPRRRLPTLLWIRLRMDLECLITEIRADGTRTLTWSHQQIREAADERYLNQRDKAPSYHKALAEYFLGKWAGKPKPFTGSERGTDRLVASQHLYYDPPPVLATTKPSPGYAASNQSQQNQKAPSAIRNAFSQNNDSLKDQPSGKQNGSTSRGAHPANTSSTEETQERLYNLRRVNELPFHLTRSQQTSLLKQNCLCNYEWMLAKLCGTSLRSLLEEYSAILTAEPHEPELRLISDVLHLSGPALRKEPRQLASQLVGRLHRIVTSDIPRSKGDPQRYPNLHPLLAAAKQSSLPALIPSVECLTEPGGILFDLLSGHSAPITAVALTSDGQRALTTSCDGTLKMWDVRSGKVVRSIDGVGPHVSAIRAAKVNTLAVTVEMSRVRLWHLKTGVCVHTVDQYPDPASICVAAEGQLLVAVFDGSNVLRTWSLDNFQITCEAPIPNNGAHKDATLLIADSCLGDLVLHAFRNGNSATVQNAKSGKILKTLTCHDPSSSVTALAISRDYFVVCVRQQYMSLHELISLELFDGKKGIYVRTVRGCIHDRVVPQAFTTNLIGTHAVAVSANPRNNTSDVALWNLETEDHKHLAQHPSYSTMGACLDFRYCMTGSPTENSLRVWDISGKVNQPGMKLKKQLGVAEIWPMIDNPRYVVAKAVHNGPISVWNVAKGKCLQSAVRIERGLTEGSDAIVMRNTTLVILTDRGFSSVSDNSRPVFQTVLVYDLKLKKYVRRLPGCYIVPAPSHEYLLLDNDSLLGPSDNRSHFIIWNLVTGHAASRIKTNFKELERRRMEQAVASGIPAGMQTGGVNLTDVPTRARPRATSAMMTPWDRRAETESARRMRHERESEQERQRQEELRREKDNVVETFMVSADQSTIVASFYAHHLCVFDIASQVHTQTLQTENSMLFLHTAGLTKDGGHLVLANYDESSKTSYVTLWDCVTGEIKRRLRNEANVAALAITDDASRVLIGHSPDELHIWDPMKPNSLRRIRGRDEGRDRGGGGGGNSVLNFEGALGGDANGGMNSACQMFIVEDGARAIVFAGDVSVWDLDRGTMLAAFSPDTRVTACKVLLDGALTLFGMYDKPELVILRLSGTGAKFQALDSGSSDDGGVELFGETTGDTSDEDEDEDEDEDGENGQAD